MLLTIELDDELRVEADEIDDKWPERVLSSELPSAIGTFAQSAPQLAFRFGFGGV